MKLAIYLTLMSAVLFSCAKVGNPSGGEKDETPPEILSSNPENFSLNIHPKEISIEFDEYVVLGNYENEWTITPPLAEKPKAKLKGRTLIIELPDSLEENTTYTFNFGESIKDLHEGNILKDNLFVFSTGAYLDSGRVAGTTILASEGSAAKEMAVGLFVSPIDSIPPKKEPRYITKSKEDGSFKFNYVKDGNYRLLAWEDKNRNKKIEDSEARAFLDSAISTLDSSLHQLHIFEESPDSLVIEKESLRENLNVLLKFNMELPANASVSSDSVAFIDQEADSINIWYQQARNVDSIVVSFNNGDTSKMLSFFPFDLSRKNASKLLLSEKRIPRTPSDSLWLMFNYPIAEDSLPLIQYTSKDTTFRQVQRYNGNSRKFYMSEVVEFGMTASYALLPLKDIYGKSMDTTRFVVGLGTKEDFGSLKVTLKGNFDGFFWLKQAKDKKTIYAVNNALNIKNLSPGTYELFFIQDRDNNGKFTTGNLLEGKQPEKVIKFEGAIEIRANWDLELEWTLK